MITQLSQETGFPCADGLPAGHDRVAGEDIQSDLEIELPVECEIDLPGRGVPQQPLNLVPASQDVSGLKHRVHAAEHIDNSRPLIGAAEDPNYIGSGLSCPSGSPRDRPGLTRIQPFRSSLKIDSAYGCLKAGGWWTPSCAGRLANRRAISVSVTRHVRADSRPRL